MIMRSLFVCSLFFLTVSSARSAPAGTGSWNILNLRYSPNPSWCFFAEGQLRSLRFYNDFHYYEYKGGFDYKGCKNIRMSLGAGSYQTYRDGGTFLLPKNNNEFRIWPQLILFQSIGRFQIEQRYRSEMRFTSSGYRNRFRYRMGISFPFGNEKEGFKPFQISMSNELFFTDNEPYFERNRLMLAFHYKASEHVSIQLGYIHQFDYKINDESGRDFLVLGLFLDVFRKVQSDNNFEIKDN